MALEAQNAFCPYVENFSIYSELVGLEAVLEFVRKALLQGYYVVADINTGYIPAYTAENPYLHNMLIYGFDDKEEKFYIADFMKVRKYGIETCSYQELKNSIEHFEDMECEFYPSGKSKLSLLRISPKAECEFRIDRFKKVLNEYLGLSDLHKKIYCNTNYFNTDENDKRIFGIGHYDNLVKYLEYGIKCNKLIDNVRVFHVFYDHKKALKQRIDFLDENVFDCSHERNIFEGIVTDALHIRNMYLKCWLKKTVEDYRSIARKIDLLKQEEFDVLASIRNKLDNSVQG